MRYKKKESELNHPNFVALRLSDVELHLLDQSARYFNSGGERSLAIESEIHQCIADLFQLRKQVLQLAGETNGSS